MEITYLNSVKLFINLMFSTSLLSDREKHHYALRADSEQELYCTLYLSKNI